MVDISARLWTYHTLTLSSGLTLYLNFQNLLGCLPLEDHDFYLHKGDFHNTFESAYNMIGCLLCFQLPMCVASPFLLSVPYVVLG